MKYSVDINCDMGESFGVYKLGRDEEVIKYISSANIACGFHASDPCVMERTAALCKSHGVMAGAHPGYPDMLGFGRRNMEMSLSDLVNSVIYQVGALQGFLSLLGIPLQHVKMHGALYNSLVDDEVRIMKLATALQKAFDKPIFLTLATPKSAALKRSCRRKGIRMALEAFPDRNYTDDGELLSRSFKNAVLKDPGTIASRAARMVKEKGIESVTGKWIDMEVDTLCIHGDNPESIEAARVIRDLFASERIALKPLTGKV